MIELLALKFLILTGPDGHTIEINPGKVVSLREPRATEHFGKKTRCLVFTGDGKFAAVREPCLEIEHRLEGAQ